MTRKRTGKKMTLITVHLTDQQIAALDKLVQLHLFPNRSEAIRTAIRELIDKYEISRDTRSSVKIDLSGMMLGL